MTEMRDYYRPVVNQAGYVLFYPCIGDEKDLLQSYPPNPYAQSEAQQFPLGTKLVQGERVWRYCRAGATLGIAAPVEGPTVANAAQNYNITTVSGALAGTTIVMTSSSALATVPNATADAFKEGYWFVNDEAGEGQCYKIKSNTAISGVANFTVELYDPLTILLTTSTECGLIHNPYNKVIASTATCANMVIGVPLLGITDTYYFWCQSGGPAPVVTYGTQVLGTMVIAGTTAAKADPMSATTAEVIIGYPLTPCSTDTETFMCFLTLDR